METAHFFWHGRPLSIYERACISSFVRHGFKANLWCYKSMEVPKGVALCNASELLPEDQIGKFSQGGRPGSIAAFSDLFRYQLLKTLQGWWFDVDVLCLKDSARFAEIRRDKAIACGLENRNLIGTGVLYVSETSIADAFLAEVGRSGVTGPWGFIGPELVTKVLKTLDLFRLAAPISTFYPIPPADFGYTFQPGTRQHATELCENALTYHLWNEYLNIAAIPRNMMPPEGSYLHARFIENCPEFQSIAALPPDTLDALLSGVALTLEVTNFLKAARKKVTRWKIN